MSNDSEATMSDSVYDVTAQEAERVHEALLEDLGPALWGEPGLSEPGHHASAWVITWDGPDEWMRNPAMHKQARACGLWLEPVNQYAVAIYRRDGQRGGAARLRDSDAMMGGFVAVGYRAWGWAPTQPAAIARMRKAGGDLADGYFVLAFAADTEVAGVSMFGDVEYDGDSPAEVAYVAGRRLKGR